MPIDPKNRRAIEETVIALDLAMAALLGSISKTNRPLAEELVIIFAAAVREAPAPLKNVALHLAEWKRLLESPPKT